MRKFTYYHCWSEELWEGYEKNGFLGENFGVRLPQTVDLPAKDKFNEALKKGGKLYNYIKKHKCGLYVDRLQGGAFIQDYVYDQDLIKEYENMLGEKFLGFQMHEWLSNYRSDVVTKLGELSSEEWTEDNIKRVILRQYPYDILFLESMNLEEITQAGKPLDYKKFYDNMVSIYKKRAKDFKLIPCDSGFMMYPFEAQNGAKIIMPEVGAQTPDMRLQMCYARGVCRAYGITLGAYYEPWGGDPLSSCSYHEDEKNEWNIQSFEDFPFVPDGPNGGSSRSLQWRIHLYAFLSGAEMISEEWGGYNTFINCKEYILSEYGLVKKAFLDFVDKYKDIGDKIAPIAAVVSNNMPCYTLDESIKYNSDKLFGFPIEGKLLEQMLIVRSGVTKIFAKQEKFLGTENHVLINSSIPDAVDMLNEGDGNALNKYKYLVDLTGEEEFSKKHNNIITPDQVEEKLHEILPCKVDGELHYLLNKRGDNGYYLTVINNCGIVRTKEFGETVLPEATRTAVITLKENRSLKILEGNKNIHYEDGKYSIVLKGGEWLFAEI